MHELLRALQLLGKWELTSINTVADISLYVGISGDNAAYVVATVFNNEVDMIKIDCSAEIALAVLNLFLRPTNVEFDTQVLYRIIGDKLPTAPHLRPIP